MNPFIKALVKHETIQKGVSTIRCKFIIIQIYEGCCQFIIIQINEGCCQFIIIQIYEGCCQFIIIQINEGCCQFIIIQINEGGCQFTSLISLAFWDCLHENESSVLSTFTWILCIEKLKMN